MTIRDELARPLVAGLVLLVVYLALASFNATGGYLGTDTGAKVATLDAMSEGGTWRPDVGYWAAAWDRDGTYHPLVFTRPTEDDQWVNVTTLPMLVLARPLYDIGGYRLSLLIPMVGSVATAFAARAFATDLGGRREGGLAFWTVGLATPMLIYALDFWEHSIGTALMLTGVLLLQRIAAGNLSRTRAVLAGVCFGAAATMRTEALVVATVAVGAVLLVLLVDRRVRVGAQMGALAVLGFVVPWLLNALLESGLGGRSRAGRASAVPQSAWWSELSTRVEEALVTWFGAPGAGFPGSVAVGVLVVLATVVGYRVRLAGQSFLGAGFVAAGAAIYVVFMWRGLAFVPGALIASPVAVGVSVLGRLDRPRRYVLTVALVSTPLIWMFQYTGGAGPQWGGRYLLAPTMLLTVLGVVALSERRDRLLRYSLVAMALAVTAFGASWLHHRSHAVERFYADLSERPEDVIISTNGFLVREAGAAYRDHFYLSIGPGGDLRGAVEVADSGGATTVGVLSHDPELSELDAGQVDSQRVTFLGVPLWYHTFRVR